MKVLRLRLRNYRGIAQREIEFAPGGVTIVSGPNEVGKSSLSEAIELYGTVLGFENTHANLRKARRLIERVDERLGALEAERRLREPAPRWPFPFPSLLGKSTPEGA